MKMPEQIISGWNLQRGIFLTVGIITIFESIINQEWIGIIFGGYFASMAIFKIGCASGNCYIAEETNVADETSRRES